jgi:predicted nucleotidyltransferase component of viral defense system
VAPGDWLLKVGFALELRLAERARATKDIDIDWRADEEQLLETLIDATTHDAGDFFVFTVERTSAPEDRLGGSHRFRVAASLAGRLFETFLLDIGFHHDEEVAPDTLTTEALLTFAEIPPVEVQAVPLELQVAEKLHAYTRTYEAGRPSSRAKDLVDFALIAELSPLDATVLRFAIETTFTRRDTHALPAVLPQPPGEWATQFRRLAEEVGAPTELAAGHAKASALLAPILNGEITSGIWSPAHKRWTSGNPKS